MDWFNEHPVLFALICAVVGVGYGLYLTYWLLGRPAGSERLRELLFAVVPKIEPPGDGHLCSTALRGARL